MREGYVVPGDAFDVSHALDQQLHGRRDRECGFAAYVTDRTESTLLIRTNDSEQTIFLVPRSRSFGGHQWYFVCPVMNRCCSVLWMPPGATRFCCREAWGSRRVAYASQFLDPRGKAKIKRRLIADLDPDEWDLPPKPKWMRWRTYDRYEERFDRYEAILEDGIAVLMAKFLAK